MLRPLPFPSPPSSNPTSSVGLMVLAHDAGGDNPEHAVVPLASACHDAGMDRGIVMLLNPLVDFTDQFPFDALASAILAIKAVSDLCCLAYVVAQQKPEGFQRRAESP